MIQSNLLKLSFIWNSRDKKCVECNLLSNKYNGNIKFSTSN